MEAPTSLPVPLIMNPLVIPTVSVNVSHTVNVSVNVSHTVNVSVNALLQLRTTSTLALNRCPILPLLKPNLSPLLSHPHQQLPVFLFSPSLPSHSTTSSTNNTLAKDLLDWDATPTAPASSTNSIDESFGGFVSAGTNPTPAAPSVDKNSILQLYHQPMAPGYAHSLPPPLTLRLSSPPHLSPSLPLLPPSPPPPPPPHSISFTPLPHSHVF